MIEPGAAACTIVAKNYLAHARVLARSFQSHHPEVPFITLLVDEPEGRFDPAGEPFQVMRLSELGIDDLPSLCFRYSVLELATAVKPLLLKHLIERRHFRKLLYLDPDIVVYRPLANLYERLSGKSILLTPHITAPIEDSRLPSEVTFLQSGAYNLGFIGVSGSALEMLGWWGRRCLDHGYSRPRDGLFVDQKWIDLVPALFRDLDVVYSLGCNVAYWNLHERRLTMGPEPRVNGEPLQFFHFSGYQPDQPGVVSKHQTRFTMADLGPGAELFTEYRRRLLAAQYEEVAHWPYTHGRFDNGVGISPVMRDLWGQLGSRRRLFGDPFRTQPGSFFAWMQERATGESETPPYLSNLVRHAWERREELGGVVPRFGDTQRPEFVAWLRRDGWSRLQLDPAVVEPMARQLGGVERGGSLWRQLPELLSPETCKVCLLMPALERHQGRTRSRVLLQRLAEAPTGGGVSDLPESWRLAAAQVLRRVLNPCSRHTGLRRILDLS